MKWLKRLASIILSLAVLVIVGTFVALQFVDMDRIKQMAQQQAFKHTGRDLIIAGDITPTLGWTPTVRLQDVKLSNPKWAKTPHLVTAKQIDITLNLKALLNGALRIEAIAVDGANLSLEADKSGKKSWAFTKPKEAVQAPAATAQQVPAESQHSADPLTIAELKLTNSAIRYHDHKNGTPIQFAIHSLTLHQLAGQRVESYQLKGRYQKLHVKASGSLNETALMLDSTVSATGVNATLKGNIALSDQAFDATLTADADSQATLLAALGQASDQAPAAPSLSISSKLGGNSKVVNARNLSLRYGELTLNGQATIDLTRSIPVLSTHLTSKDASLEAILAQFGTEGIIKDGALKGDLIAQSSGTTPDEWLNNLSGTFNFYLDKANYLAPPTAIKASNFLQLLTANTKQDSVEITCAIGQFDIANGVATSNLLALKSPQAVVGGKGNINLPAQQLDLVLKTRSGSLGLADLAPPLRVHGSLASPSLTPDTSGTLIGVGKWVLGATTGVGLVALLGEQVADRLGITADNNPCLQAIAEADKKTQEATPKEQYKQLEDNVREKRDAIKDDVKKDIKTIEKDVKTIRDGLKGMFKKQP